MPARLTWQCNQHGDEASIRRRAALHLLAGNECSRQRLSLVPWVAASCAKHGPQPAHAPRSNWTPQPPPEKAAAQHTDKVGPEGQKKPLEGLRGAQLYACACFPLLGRQ